MAGDWMDWLIQRRFVLLLVAGLLYGGSYLVSTPAFDRSLERMFADNDPELAPFQRFQRTFGGNAVVLAVYDDPQILSADGDGLRRLAGISDRCRKIAGVRDVFSLDRILGDGVVLHDPVAQRLIDLFTGITHGEDRTAVAIVCLLDAKMPEMHAAAVDQLKQLLNQPGPGLEPGYVTGEPVLVHEGFQLVESDGRKLSFWTLALLSLTIMIGFQRIRWMIATFLIVHVAIRLTESIVAVSGLRLTLVSSMLSAIIAVVAIATMVHLIHWFRYHYRRLGDPRRALDEALQQVSSPIVWSCITDAVGFGSLLFAHVAPVRDFGAMTAIGSLVVLACVFAIFPTIALWRFRDPRPNPLDTRGESRILRSMINQVFDRPWLWLGASLTLACVLGCGSLWTEVETDFTRNFHRESSIVRAYEHVEQRLGGAGVLEIALPAPDRLTWSYLEGVLRLEERLRRELIVQPHSADPSSPGNTGSLTKVLSLADALLAGSPVDLSTIPNNELRDIAIQAGLRAMQLKMPAFVDTLLAPDPDDSGRRWFRVMLRAREQQGVNEKLSCIKAIRRIVEEDTEHAEWIAASETNHSYVTGYFVLLSRLIQSVSQDQWLTFGAAIVGVAFCLALAFRRPMIVVIALIPNVIPGIIVLGIMGWLGLKVNMGAAMIAAVSMGLTVDSSVHYLASYLRERSEGQSVYESLQTVQQGVGQAATLSTIALMVGFSVLCTSEFVPTVYFGFLVNLAMLGGLCGNLWLLPLLLRLWDRHETIAELDSASR